jgi:RNA polymerase sigma factor (sigma-70 family)
MPEAPATRQSLLLRLRDFQDEKAWSQFVEVYAPLIYAYVRKRGLQDADAADLTQVCIRKVSDHVGKFDYIPGRDSFRGWLFTIVRNKLHDFHARPKHLWQGSGDSQIRSLLENQPAPANGDASEWEREYEQSLFSWAADKVKPQVQPTTWQAFWQTAVEGRPGQEVAKNLGISLAAVYIAKSRVIVRLREAIRAMQENDNGTLSR